MTSKTFPITQPIKLDARIANGSLRVTAVDDLTEATVTLTARTESPESVDRVGVEMRGTTLHISAPRQGSIFDMFGARTRDAVDVEVTVPSGTPLKIGSHTAEVTLVGRCGTADIAAGSAEITAEYVDGDLRLRSGNGSCRIERVSGAVHAGSGNGNGSFGEVGGALSFAGGNGGLEVETARGSVRFRTGSGGATLGATYGDVDIASGRGELRIGVPAGVSARLDVISAHGHVATEIPIEQSSSGNGRIITVRARTGSGNVHLFRAVA